MTPEEKDQAAFDYWKDSVKIESDNFTRLISETKSFAEAREIIILFEKDLKRWRNQVIDTLEYIRTRRTK